MTAAIPTSITRPVAPPIRAEVFWPLLLSGAAWLALISLAAAGVPLALCLSSGGSYLSDFTASLAAQVIWLDFGQLALEWGLMCAAMMAPLFVAVVQRVSEGSFHRQRRRNIALVSTSYAAIIGAAGVPAVGLMILARAVLDSTGLLVAAPLAGFGMAALWHVSAPRLRALRRCHRPFLPSRSAGSVVVYGLGQGWYCGLACLPAMFAPMLSAQGIVPMFVVMHLLLHERMTHRPPVREIRTILIATGTVLTLAIL